MKAGWIHISFGGPIYRISVGGKIHVFEMHPYCGPIKLKPNLNEAKPQPMQFLKAASLWAQQGQRMQGAFCRGDLCLWDHEPEEILKHLRGNTFKLMGYKPARRGA